MLPDWDWKYIHVPLFNYESEELTGTKEVAVEDLFLTYW